MPPQRQLPRQKLGEAAKMAGVSAQKIRHDERVGLFPVAAHAESGCRQYADKDVDRLRFITMLESARP
ncbi:MAG: MerR family transcriptional regulator [Burkholderiales bacterium]|nr:MerR family transcriptional regulator [Burkholderiales bacterium]MBW8893490.1 MerR family transcriptional regulator [Burkholderiales bacterium]